MYFIQHEYRRINQRRYFLRKYRPINPNLAKLCEENLEMIVKIKSEPN
jgi:hypothetical protein